MKTKLFLLLLVPMILSACGKEDPAAVAVPTAAGTCQNGQVLGQTGGCLSPSGTQGYGINANGQAVPASCWAGTVMTAQGCWPQDVAANYNNTSYPNNNYPNNNNYQNQCRQWAYSYQYGYYCVY